MHQALLIVAALVAQPHPGDGDVLGYLRAANESNIQKFKHGRVVFETVRMEEFGKGELRAREPAGAIKAKGRLAFDSKNALLVLEYDDLDLISGTLGEVGNKATMSVMSRILLSDGSSTLNDTPILDSTRGVIVDSLEVHPEKGFDLFRSLAKFVYPVGVNNLIVNRLGDDLRDVQNGNASVSDVNTDKSKADLSKIVQFTITRNNGWTRKYVVDLEKGAIPVEVRDFRPDGKLVNEKLYANLTVFRPGGWFPRSFRVNIPDAGISELYVVTEADFDQTPAESEFKVRFRAPTSFTDQAAGIFVKNATEYSLIDRKKRRPTGSVKVRLNDSPGR